MRIKVYLKSGIKDVMLLKHKERTEYSFVNLTDGYIDEMTFSSKDNAISFLNSKKESEEIKNYKIVDDGSFLEDGIFIGNYFVPNSNPKKLNCTRDELIFEDNKIVGLKKLKFTCDNCSSPMTVMYGPHGYFVGCKHWNSSESCKKNTIRLNILD